MADQPARLEDLPSAVPDSPRRVRLPYVWILPLLVVLAGGFVAVRQKLAQGTAIEITFRSADDLEPSKTKIKYKAVEIGEVTEVHVSKDRKSVVVEARIHRDSRDYLVADTRFWVVRPRVTGAGVSGLGTLVSGAYIDVAIGHSTEPQRLFTGLEIPPVVTEGLAGREFVLHADDIGSLTIGSDVFYRHIPAGQVVAYSLDPGGASVTIKVFVNSPYDGYVTSTARFWQASGIDMSIDSEGVKLRTESLAAILEGGIAFQSMPDAPPAKEVAPDTTFGLFPDREHAMREPDATVERFVMYFKGSLRGLSVGAPVDLRGITIGEVRSLSVEYNRNAGVLRFPVLIDLFPARIGGRADRDDRATANDASELASRTLIDSMVAHGMRAEIKTGNLLTGQKYVAVDVHHDVAAERIDWDQRPPVFPTASGALDEIQDSLGSIAKKIEKVPFDQLSAHLLATLSSLEQTLKSTDKLMKSANDTVAPQVNATLKQAEEALKNAKQALGQDAPLQTDLGSTLLELSRAAKSVSALADFLERHPESLIRGKRKDPE